jgi:hypothetical protein
MINYGQSNLLAAGHDFVGYYCACDGLAEAERVRELTTRWHLIPQL